MRKLTAIVIPLMIASIIAGCAPLTSAHVVPPQIVNGDVLILSERGTIYFINAVQNGEVTGAQIFMRGREYAAYLWPINKVGWATLVVDLRRMVVSSDPSELIKHAGLMNGKTTTDLVQALMDNGFKRVDVKEVPPILGLVAKTVKAAGGVLITLPKETIIYDVDEFFGKTFTQ